MKMFRVVVNGSEYNVEIEELTGDSPSHAPRRVTQTSAPAAPVQNAAPTPSKPEPSQNASAPAATGAIVAPMPGTVLKVEISAGSEVKKGQTLLVLEAMKMENEIMAPADGVVQELNVSEGISVNAGDVLVVLSA